MDFSREWAHNPSIESQHELIENIGQVIPDDCTTDALPGAPAGYDVKNGHLINLAMDSFGNQLKTFLALNDRLNVLDNEQELANKLARGSLDNLRAWLQLFELVRGI